MKGGTKGVICAGHGVRVEGSSLSWYDIRYITEARFNTL